MCGPEVPLVSVCSAPGSLRKQKTFRSFAFTGWLASVGFIYLTGAVLCYEEHELPLSRGCISQLDTRMCDPDRAQW